MTPEKRPARFPLGTTLLSVGLLGSLLTVVIAASMVLSTVMTEVGTLNAPGQHPITLDDNGPFVFTVNNDSVKAFARTRNGGQAQQEALTQTEAGSPDGSTAEAPSLDSDLRPSEVTDDDSPEIDPAQSETDLDFKLVTDLEYDFEAKPNGGYITLGEYQERIVAELSVSEPGDYTINATGDPSLFPVTIRNHPVAPVVRIVRTAGVILVPFLLLVPAGIVVMIRNADRDNAARLDQIGMHA